jgi:hypothetical protein
MFGSPTLYVVSAIAGASAIVAIWTHGYSTGDGDRKAAIVAAETARDNHWQKEIKKANEAHEKVAEFAQAEGAKVADTPADLSERIRLCEQSPTCRNNQR